MEEDFYDDMLVFLDESAANEFTKDRKSGWSLRGVSAIKERDFRRSERWSILPAYTSDGYMAWKIFRGHGQCSNTSLRISQNLCNRCATTEGLYLSITSLFTGLQSIEQSFNQIKMEDSAVPQQILDELGNNADTLGLAEQEIYLGWESTDSEHSNI